MDSAAVRFNQRALIRSKVVESSCAPQGTGKITANRSTEAYKNPMGVPRKNTSTRKISIPHRSATSAWRCRCCSLTVSREEVVFGKAVMLENKVVCSKCHEKERKPARLRLVWLIALACTGIAFLSGLLFPTKLLSISVLVSLFMAFFGGIAWALSRATRLCLIGLGVLLCIICVIVHAGVREDRVQNEQERALLLLAERAKDAIEQKHFQDARGLVDSFQREAQRSSGKYFTSHLAETAKDVRCVFDNGMATTYGVSCNVERTLLVDLFTEFSEFDSTGIRRFRFLKMEEHSFSIGIAGSNTSTIRPFVRDLATHLFKAYPDLDRQEIEWTIEENGFSSEDASRTKTLVLLRSQLPELGSGFLSEMIPSP